VTSTVVEGLHSLQLNAFIWVPVFVIPLVLEPALNQLTPFLACGGGRRPPTALHRLYRARSTFPALRTRLVTTRAHSELSMRQAFRIGARPAFRMRMPATPVNNSRAAMPHLLSFFLLQLRILVLCYQIPQ